MSEKEINVQVVHGGTVSTPEEFTELAVEAASRGEIALPLRLFPEGHELAGRVDMSVDELTQVFGMVLSVYVEPLIHSAYKAGTEDAEHEHEQDHRQGGAYL